MYDEWDVDNEDSNTIPNAAKEQNNIVGASKGINSNGRNIINRFINLILFTIKDITKIG